MIGTAIGTESRSSARRSPGPRSPSIASTRRRSISTSRSGEWRDRAGGYAIQGLGSILVRSISGDFSNVVGLPVPTLLELVPALRI